MTPEKPPSKNPEEPATVPGKSRVMVLMPAVRMLLTAMPAKMSVVRESPARAASR